jgi:glycosyltransferase involved in cell wall biosynthesis
LLIAILLGYIIAKRNKGSEGQIKKLVKLDKNCKVLIVIPAYNERENILKTYKSIIDYNKKHKTRYDVIVINDGSKDDTREICERNNIPVINLIHNLGIGGAVQTGYKYAYENSYDIAIQFDGDGQHDIESVKDLIKPITDGQAEFVIGSRFVSAMNNFKSTKARRIGISIISTVIRIVTGKKVCDTTSGFRACNKEIISSFALHYPTEYPEPVTTVELLKQGYIIDEVPAKMKERTGGTSSIKSLKNVYYMINVILSIIVVGMRRYK